MSKKLYKSAAFTDIHFGRRQNSETHNQDCLDFVTWFVEQVKADPTIDHVNFYGDWNEHRNAINGLTMDYSYRAAKLLNSLDMPVFFIVGNHDLYFRNNRNVFTTFPYESLDNFKLIKEITVVEEVGDKGSLYVPFLFEDEFPKLLDYVKYPVVHGHLEFAGFVITGDTIIKEHGPDHKLYKSFKRIFTGHYHKRQSIGNVHYIGSTHPMDFSDAGDVARGMAIYDHRSDDLSFIDWPDCPSYTRCKVSDVISDPKSVLRAKGYVKAYVDIELDQPEVIALKEKLVKKYNVRELHFEENKKQNIQGDETIDESLKEESIDTIIKEKLKTVEVEGIETDFLLSIYEAL